MKYLLILISLYSGLAISDTSSDPTFTIRIENAGKKVSPGGELLFSLQGSHKSNKSISLVFETNISGVVNKYSHHGTAYWYGRKQDPHTTRKYFIAFIADDTSATSVSLIAQNQREGVEAARIVFYVTKGTYGHRLKTLKGFHVAELKINADERSFYRLTCIEGVNGAGHCRMNLKDSTNTDYGPSYYFNDVTQEIIFPRYGCTDEDWDAGSRLAIRSPFLFDMSKLIHKDNNNTTDHLGRALHNSSVCLIQSDGPILLESVTIVPKVE